MRGIGTDSRIGGAAVLLVMAGVLMACGSGADLPEPAAGGGSAEVVGSGAEVVGGPQFTQDPCSLLTEQEAAAVLGVQVVEVPFSEGGLRRCTWRGTKQSSTAPDITLDLNSPRDNGYTKQKVVDNIDLNFEQRVDVGDGGFLLTGKQHLTVLVGDSSFTVFGPHSDDEVIAVARYIAPRLR